MEEKYIKRFWNKVTIRGDHECWEWVGAKKSGRYGQLNINGKTVSAHRISAHLADKLKHLDDKKVVCHKCDNPGCVNPHHLFVGTQKDNMKDCVKKGRRARGEQHRNSKLTEKDIIEIRRLHGEEGLSQKEIGSLFGVCHSTVGGIVRGEQWQHI